MLLLPEVSMQLSLKNKLAPVFGFATLHFGLGSRGFILLGFILETDLDDSQEKKKV